MRRGKTYYLETLQGSDLVIRNNVQGLLRSITYISLRNKNSLLL